MFLAYLQYCSDLMQKSICSVKEEQWDPEDWFGIKSELCQQYVELAKHLSQAQVQERANEMQERANEMLPKALHENLKICSFGRLIKKKTGEVICDEFVSVRKAQSVFHPYTYTYYTQTIVCIVQRPYYVLIDHEQPESILFHSSLERLREEFQSALKKRKTRPLKHLKKDRQKTFKPDHNSIQKSIWAAIQTNNQDNILRDLLSKEHKISPALLQTDLGEILNQHIRSKKLKQNLKVFNLLMGRYDPRHTFLIKLSRRVITKGSRFELSEQQVSNDQRKIFQAINSQLLVQEPKRAILNLQINQVPVQEPKKAVLNLQILNNEAYSISREFLSLRWPNKRSTFSFKSVLNKDKKEVLQLKQGEDVIFQSENIMDCMTQFLERLIDKHSPQVIQQQFQKLIHHELSKSPIGQNKIARKLFDMEMSCPTKGEREEQEFKEILKRANVNYLSFKEQFESGRIDLVNGKIFYSLSQ